MNEAYNLDCMEYMKTLPDNAFDLAVVDPPYGDAGADSGFAEGKRFGERFDRYKKVERRGGQWAERYTNKIVSWDVAPNQQYFDELFRIAKSQIIWGGNYFSLPPTRCFLIWRKTNIPDGFTMAQVEYAWTSFNTNAVVFEFSSAGQPGRFHPTQKPVELYRWIFSKFAKQGDRIIDTHLGSGSSRIAAYDAGLDFVGCEIDAEYFQAQEQRFAEHTAQLNLFLEGNI